MNVRERSLAPIVVVLARILQLVQRQPDCLGFLPCGQRVQTCSLVVASGVFDEMAPGALFGGYQFRTWIILFADCRKLLVC